MCGARASCAHVHAPAAGACAIARAWTHRLAGVEAPHVILCRELLHAGVSAELRAGELQLHVPQVVDHGGPPRALGRDVRGRDLERRHESLDGGIELPIFPIGKCWEDIEGPLRFIHQDQPLVLLRLSARQGGSQRRSAQGASGCERLQSVTRSSLTIS